MSSITTERLYKSLSFIASYVHFNAENCHDFAIYKFRLVKSYKLFRVGPPLEILQNHSQKQPPELFHKKFFSNILRYSQEKTCVGGLVFNKVAGHQSCSFIKTQIKRHSKTGIPCDYRKIYNNTLFGEHLRMVALESLL